MDADGNATTFALIAWSAGFFWCIALAGPFGTFGITQTMAIRKWWVRKLIIFFMWPVFIFLFCVLWFFKEPEVAVNEAPLLCFILSCFLIYFIVVLLRFKPYGHTIRLKKAGSLRSAQETLAQFLLSHNLKLSYGPRMSLRNEACLLTQPTPLPLVGQVHGKLALLVEAGATNSEEDILLHLLLFDLSNDDEVLMEVDRAVVELIDHLQRYSRLEFQLEAGPFGPPSVFSKVDTVRV